MKRHIVFVFTIGFLFAISDEVHQYFVPGRNADIFDLLVDWCAISLSLLCFKTVCKLWEITIKRNR